MYPNISIRLPVSFLKILKITFLLDFLHYSVDNLHFEHPNDVRGGDEENRTPDPLLARQVLSQLSYTPTWCFKLY